MSQNGDRSIHMTGFIGETDVKKAACERSVLCYGYKKEQRLCLSYNTKFIKKKSVVLLIDETLSDLKIAFSVYDIHLDKAQPFLSKRVSSSSSAY
jgi:hypothetical protein